MNTKNFKVDKLREDVRAYVAVPGNSIHGLAKAAGVEWVSLRRFMSDPKAGISAITVEKLWPVLYPQKAPGKAA